MKLRLAVLAIATLSLGGCYYAPYGGYYGYAPYGYYNPYAVDPAGAALVGAGVGALAGAAIVSSYRPYYGYHGYRRW